VAIGGSGTIQEIDAKVADLASLSDEQLSVLHGAGPATEFAYRNAWARSYLKRVEAVEDSARGVWAITTEGRRLSEDEIRQLPHEYGQ